MFPPVDSTRRRFLSQSAGVAAGAAILATAAIPSTPAAAAPAGQLDPVFGLIEAHRTARTAHLVASAEQTRLDRIGDPASDDWAQAECEADMAALGDLIQTAATTFAGLQAWAAYLDEISSVEGWMFEEVEAPALVTTLAEALGNLAVSS